MRVEVVLRYCTLIKLNSSAITYKVGHEGLSRKSCSTVQLLGVGNTVVVLVVVGVGRSCLLVWFVSTMKIISLVTFHTLKMQYSTGLLKSVN